jgi:hypothetical protein
MHKIPIHLSYLVTRVNAANVLDEGLRIGGRGHRMNSKVKISQTRWGLVCIENKRGTQLAQSQYVPGRPLLAPLYGWPGLEEPVGFSTNYNVCIWYHLVFQLHLCLGLDGAMLRHPVGNPKRKVLLSTAANFPQLWNQGLIEPVGESQTLEGDAC